MKILKIIIAIILTFVLLYIARQMSMGEPRHIVYSENGFTFDFHTVPKGFEKGKTKIPITIKGNITPDLKPVFRQSKFGQDKNTDIRFYKTVPLLVEDSVQGKYYTEVSTGKRGGRFYYYFGIRDNSGGRRATFTHENHKPFLFKFIGHVPILVLIGHLTFIFVTVFFISMGTINSFSLITGKGEVKNIAPYFLWATIFAFIGCYFFGVAMNWYAFGSFWEGVPFGTDATDNKTQLLFVYLLFTTLSMLGTLIKHKDESNIFSSKTLGWMGIISFLVMLFIYLIPHSIQFSKGLTYGFCYSFIGLVALIYIIGLIKHFLQNKPSS